MFTELTLAVRSRLNRLRKSWVIFYLHFFFNRNCGKQVTHDLRPSRNKKLLNNSQTEICKPFIMRACVILQPVPLSLMQGPVCATIIGWFTLWQPFATLSESYLGLLKLQFSFYFIHQNSMNKQFIIHL